MDRTQRRDDPAAMIRTALRGMMSELWSALPGIVESVDLDKQTVTVQPATRSRIRLDDGTYTSVPMPLLPDVPIVFPSGGGYTLTFPVRPGDECLVVFADRCIDAWWQSGEVQEQADLRQHDLSDGIAIIGPRSQPRKLGDVSASAVQLRSDDASSYVEISDAGMTLKHPVKVTIDAPESEITGTLTVAGLLSYLSGLSGTGGSVGSNISGPLTSNGVTLHTHHHTGVQSGGSNTGGPA